MKSTIVIIIIINILISCKGQTNVGKIVNQGITLDSTLVKNFYKDINYKENSFDFDTIASIKKDINNNGLLDKIKLLKIKEWDDSGDFQRLIISLDDGQVYDVINYDGWSKIQESMKKSSLIPSDYFGLYQNSYGNNLLILSGFVYGSGPSFSTIFDFSKGIPRIIYNLESNFDSIDNRNNMILIKGYTKDNSFSLKIKDGSISIDIDL